ncbi:hypothetical protein Taro_048901 [Colocasia esculenta]|uniref:Uncharacterized protein n=1 Tax=Colocasia esculenta TaxID=4460 RepID=A0A843X9C3_COLES|nr:hypothetical protein [Colocasia esculenta]
MPRYCLRRKDVVLGLRFIPTPSAKELGITFRTGIGIAYVITIRNRHSETVDRALVSRNSVPGPKFPPERVSQDVVSGLLFIPTPSAKELDITFRTGIGIAYVTTIRNRYSETVDRALVSRNSLTISPIPRSDSLDYANRWQSPYAEPPSHSDRKSCSTQREISSPGRGYGCPNIADIFTPSAKELDITFRTGIGIAYVTTIRNRYSETVDRALVSRNSVPGPKFPPERVFLVRRPNSSPGVRSQAADAIAYEHRFAQTGITFRTGIGIAYVTTIRNRHSETVDRALWTPKIPNGPILWSAQLSSTK